MIITLIWTDIEDLKIIPSHQVYLVLFLEIRHE